MKEATLTLSLSNFLLGQLFRTKNSSKVAFCIPEAEFLDVWSFPSLLFIDLTPPPPPPHPGKIGLILFCNLNIVYGNLTSSLRSLKIMPRNLNGIVRS
jgi:hypothetical protein